VEWHCNRFHRTLPNSVKAATALAVMAMSGMESPAFASASAYAEYCYLHPHKSYCWDRHHPVPLKHRQSSAVSSSDIGDCDQPDDPDRSIRACTRLIEKDPRDAVAYYNRAVAHDEKKDYDGAIADYTKAIDSHLQAVAYSNRGYAYTHKRDYDRAFADYASASASDPGYADTYFNRGNAYDDIKDFDRAAAEYTKAIAINPMQADFYSDRGLAYAANGHYDAAIVDFDKALALDPNDPQAYDSRGGAHIGLGRYDKAIADFNKAIELYPTHPTPYEHRGYARFYNGEFIDAASDLSRALEHNVSAYPMLFRFLARSRNGESASAELQANAGRLKTREWPYPVIQLYLGVQQPGATLKSARNDIERCQAEFYIGEWNLLGKNLTAAAAALHSAAASCPKTRLEYDAATAEIKRLRR
jgi:tetratricopeptide (TPR) repeat protein